MFRAFPPFRRIGNSDYFFGRPVRVDIKQEASQSLGSAAYGKEHSLVYPPHYLSLPTVGSPRVSQLLGSEDDAD